MSFISALLRFSTVKDVNHCAPPRTKKEVCSCFLKAENGCGATLHASLYFVTQLDSESRDYLELIAARKVSSVPLLAKLVLEKHNEEA